MDDGFYDYATVVLVFLGIAAAVVFLFFLGGCGDSSGSTTVGSNTDGKSQVAFAEKSVDHRFVLETESSGGFSYRGTSDTIEDENNPTLTVEKGDTVVITLVNDDGMPHDLALPEFGMSTDSLYSEGSRESFLFRADSKGEFPYYCTVGSHRQVGMEGTLVVE